MYWYTVDRLIDIYILLKLETHKVLEIFKNNTCNSHCKLTNVRGDKSFSYR